MPSTRRVWLPWLALLLAYFAVLGCRPLRLPDEVRYADISREMLDSGDWVVPRLLRLPCFDQPVGGSWLNNTSQIVLGIPPSSPPFAILIGNAIVDGLDRGRSLALQWLSRPQAFARLAAHERRRGCHT
jgi:4-amino-4-deoxy-L-arabinose transferase